MRYKLMGRSGLRVSELALGTMTFGEEWGWGASEQESRRMGDAHAEANGCTPSQVAIAWVRQQDAQVIPLIGARNLPQLTDSLGALAELYVEQGDAKKAEALFRQSLAIREDKLGADHPKVTETLEAYSELLRTMGRESEAEELSLRAAAGGERGN